MLQNRENVTFEYLLNKFFVCVDLASSPMIEIPFDECTQTFSTGPCLLLVLDYVPDIRGKGSCFVEERGLLSLPK